MQIDSGTVGVYQRIGNVTFHAGAIANKYSFFHGLTTQYGLDGSLTYQFSHKISFTAFGTYYFRQHPMMSGGSLPAPSIAGYFCVSKFGGYINYDASDRVGVLVGGQAVQQLGTQNYKAEPIVTPYIKFGSGKNKFAIGLPVGQILNGLLRNQ